MMHSGQHKNKISDIKTDIVILGVWSLLCAGWSYSTRGRLWL